MNLKKRLERAGILVKICGTMKFSLIDKIVKIDSGSTLVATKSVSLAEEYLQDHFPAFPVLPGVFLLQGMIETASWLVREHQDFANSMVLLKKARNVKFKSFAAPGMTVTYSAVVKMLDEKTSSFQVSGVSGDEAIVEARLDLRHFNLADDNPLLAGADKDVVDNLKHRWKLLTQ
ncbi:MAG: beta-hydroxyacyl-ACP dehydratase [Phycisphaerae bacterium]|jgi:3-hydroxyacyl-[acyl-carrier-protein] dehydratase